GDQNPEPGKRSQETLPPWEVASLFAAEALHAGQKIAGPRELRSALLPSRVGVRARRRRFARDTLSRDMPPRRTAPPQKRSRSWHDQAEELIVEVRALYLA